MKTDIPNNLTTFALFPIVLQYNDTYEFNSLSFQPTVMVTEVTIQKKMRKQSITESNVNISSA